MADISDTLQPLAEQLSLLTAKLRYNTDPEVRRTLLREFRALIAEADKIVSRQED